MSTAARVAGTLLIVGVALVVLLGPRWRGAFSRSWLRPRLLAFGILLVIFSTGLYLYRVYYALHSH